VPLQALAAAAMVVLGGAAEAGQCGHAQCWGAVGIGPNGAYGYSFDAPSESRAISIAQSGCGGNCTQIKTFYNTCGAMAQGSNGAWGFGWANTRGQAEANAMAYCRQNGPNCGISVWSCSR
jgi:hypothetical protein